MYNFNLISITFLSCGLHLMAWTLMCDECAWFAQEVKRLSTRAVQKPLEGQVLKFQKGAHWKRLICRHNITLQFAVEGVTGEGAAVRGLCWSETLDIKKGTEESY